MGSPALSIAQRPNAPLPLVERIGTLALAGPAGPSQASAQAQMQRTRATARA
jgi:hypothetical protein